MKCPRCRYDIKVRSNNQGRYYFGYIVDEIAYHTGHSPNEIHEILKQMFLVDKIIKINNKDIIITRSTTDLSTVEMEEYLLRVRAWASADLNLFLRIPNKEDY